jgi:hypothetical protein
MTTVTFELVLELLLTVVDTRTPLTPMVPVVAAAMPGTEEMLDARELLSVEELAKPELIVDVSALLSMAMVAAIVTDPEESAMLTSLALMVVPLREETSEATEACTDATKSACRVLFDTSEL